MTPADLEVSFQNLQIAVGQTMGLIRTETDGLLKLDRKADDSRGLVTLSGLFALLFDRARASRTLVAHNMDWDAEIVLRAFYETTAKILRLCISPEAEKGKLLHEYWVEAAEIHNRKRKTRASWIEAKSKPDDKIVTAIFSFLIDDAVTPINPQSTKAERKLIEQRWSFGWIMEYLSEHSDETLDLGNARLLMHAYGMASHFAHADHNALDLMADRNYRTPDDRRMIETSHAARILTDQTSLGFLCATVLSRHLNLQFSDKTTLVESVQNCLDISEPIMNAFYESQRPFYEQYGYKFSEDSSDK